MKRKTGAVVLSLAFSGAAGAQWAQEPTVVFGVPIGAPIPSGTVPICEEANVNNGYRGTRGYCLEPRQSLMPFAKLQGIGLPRVSDDARVYFDGEAVERIEVAFHHDAYPRMKAMLIERYGAPSATKSSNVTTRNNVTVASETIKWAGQSTSIVVLEHYSNLQTAIAIFSSNAIAARKGLAEKDGVKAGAAKF